MSRTKEGICRLCGNYGQLSFEHIPPKSAFNDQQQLFQTIQDILSGRSHSKFRKGLGKYSLCEKCNTLTGGWYGTAFVSWTSQGMHWRRVISGKTGIALPFHIMPLNVLKQILVMTLAMSSPVSLDYHSELRRLVLNKEQKYLPSRYRVHVYFNVDGQPRFASDMAVMRVQVNQEGDLKARGADYIEAEVALPPFGYCVSTPIRGIRSLAAHQELCDITWFSKFGYNEWTTVYLELAAFGTHEPFPLDYRTESEIEGKAKPGV